MGHQHEIIEFSKWFHHLPGYKHKVMIAGNHDFGFEKLPEESREAVARYPNVIYLQDNMVNLDGIKIWGSPWQPKFYNWAFNLPKNGDELKSKWDMIPENVNLDILITHGPPFGHLDTVKGESMNLGCELLAERLKIVKPKIHVFGHIHSGYGVKVSDGTLFVNASVLNEQYIYTNEPFTIDFDFITKEWDFVD
jgi:Icc-related predicted phosphoesterase